MLSTCFKDTATLINLCRIIYCELDNGCLIMSYYVNCFNLLILNNIYPNLIFLFILTFFKHISFIISSIFYLGLQNEFTFYVFIS